MDLREGALILRIRDFRISPLQGLRLTLFVYLKIQRAPTGPEFGACRLLRPRDLGEIFTFLWKTS